MPAARTSTRPRRLRTAALHLMVVAAVAVGLTAPAAVAATAAPATLTGVVTVAGTTEPVPNAAVFAYGFDLFATNADATGRYRFDGLPAGEYDVIVQPGRCLASQTTHRSVSGTTRADFALQQFTDPYGYTCRDSQDGTFIPAGTVLPLTGNDASVRVALPFPARLYGQAYSSAHVSTNGFVSFTAASTARLNAPLPSTAAPNAALYPFWDDLAVRFNSSIRTAVVGTAPSRRFVIEYRNMGFSSYQFAGARLTFEIVLNENNGNILFLYQGINPSIDPNNDDARAEQGRFATIGIENQSGTTAFQYTHNRATLHTGQAILFRPPAG